MAWRITKITTRAEAGPALPGLSARRGRRARRRRRGPRRGGRHDAGGARPSLRGERRPAAEAPGVEWGDDDPARADGTQEKASKEARPAVFRMAGGRRARRCSTCVARTGGVQGPGWGGRGRAVRGGAGAARAYRAVDVRRRWSCACLLVLLEVAPDHALRLVSVLSAYSLQASCVVVASGGRSVAAWAGSEQLSEASGALARQRRLDSLRSLRSSPWSSLWQPECGPALSAPGARAVFLPMIADAGLCLSSALAPGPDGVFPPRMAGSALAGESLASVKSRWHAPVLGRRMRRDELEGSRRRRVAIVTQKWQELPAQL